MGVDKGRIEKAVREIIEAIGEDPDRDGLQRTPMRIAEMYDEIFHGLHDDPSKHLTVTFEADHDEMVMVRDIAVHSVCEHHLVPFAGRAHVAYIPGPDGRIARAWPKVKADGHAAQVLAALESARAEPAV